MSFGLVAHQLVEVTAATIAAASSSEWTTTGSTLPDCLGLIILNDLDEGVDISFDGTNSAFKLAAGEPIFLNYHAVGKLFGACTVYIKKLSADPTSGSLRITGILRKSLK